MLENHPYNVLGQTPFTCFNGVAGSRLHLVHTPHEWKTFYELLMEQKLVACDTETSGFRYYAGDRIVGMSFGWQDDHFYIPVRHLDSVHGGVQPAQLNMDDLREDLKRFFAQQDIYTLFHNCKFDTHFYRADNINIAAPFHDTSILWHLYDENAPGALKKIASGWVDLMKKKHAGLVGPSANEKEKEVSDWRSKEAAARRALFRQLVLDAADKAKTEIQHQDKNRKELKQWLIDNELKDHKYKHASKDDVHYGYIPIPLMTEYAATDTFLTYKLYEYLGRNLSLDAKLKDLYVNEIKLSKALTDIEEAGLKVDKNYLGHLGIQMDQDSLPLEDKIKAVLGDVNIQSPSQLLGGLLAHGVPLTRKTKSKKKIAVDEKALSKFKNKYEVISDILNLRKINKIKNTYVTGILDKLVGEDNMLRCSFNQNVSTGRLSSLEPNFTNFPSRDTRIRRAFLNPSNDYVYVFADYSQVELRMTAHYSQDPLLLDSYARGQDVHTRTTCEMFGFKYDIVQPIIETEDKNNPDFVMYKEHREIGKRLNFAIIYGVGAEGLSDQLKRPSMYKDLSDEDWVEVCDSYIESYMNRYVGVKQFINKSGREIKRNGMVTNPFGRVRHLPHVRAVEELGKEYFWMVAKAQRQGTNFIIQGCQDPSAPILTEIGYVPLKELENYGKPALITYSGLERDYKVLDTGKKDCVEVRTSTATGICSTKHKYFVYDSSSKDLVFRGIDELLVGDFVCADYSRIVPGMPTKVVSIEEAELLGALIGDGHYGKLYSTSNAKDRRKILRNQLSICVGKQYPEYKDRIVSLWKKIFPNINVRIQDKYATWDIMVEGKDIRQRFLDLGLDRVVRENKIIPEWVNTQPVEIRSAVIRGLLDTDGGINGNCVGFTSKVVQISLTLQNLLASIGIRSSFNKTKEGYTRLVIPIASLDKLIKYNCITVKHKVAHVVHMSDKYAKTARPDVPKSLINDVCVVLKSHMKEMELTESQKTAIWNRHMSKVRALSLLNSLETKSQDILNFIDLLSQEWVEIRDITSVGVLPTMDLELHGEDHSYICRGLVQHNTCADVFKIAVTRVHDVLQHTQSRIVNLVHDEIQTYVHKDEIHLLNKMRDCMEDFNFTVPLKVDFSYSKTNWADKKKLG
jgi:DNA polymerase I-like protein with 3'-5' exonuclease and polymerase domains